MNIMIKFIPLNDNVREKIALKNIHSTAIIFNSINNASVIMIMT